MSASLSHSALSQAAASHSVDVMVLGAWGCGVFRNDPKDIATMFRDALRSVHLRVGAVFAVPAGRNKKSCPLAAFRTVFGRAATSLAAMAGQTAASPPCKTDERSKAPKSGPTSTSTTSTNTATSTASSTTSNGRSKPRHAAPKPTRTGDDDEAECDAALRQFAVQRDGDVVPLVDIGGGCFCGCDTCACVCVCVCVYMCVL